MTSETWEVVVFKRKPDSTSLITDITERLRVPGGWIYRTTKNALHVGEADGDCGYRDAVAMVFVPKKWWAR